MVLELEEEVTEKTQVGTKNRITLKGPAKQGDFIEYSYRILYTDRE